MTSQEGKTLKLYLKMKNASASGNYDEDKDVINVFSGAIFEKKISQSFKEHHYNSLRNKLMSEGYLSEDFILKKNYEFNSLSSAAAVIGGRSASGTIEWKTEKGIRYKDIRGTSDNLNFDSNEEKYKHITSFLEDIDILKQLEDETKFNIFETLLIVNKEIRHSNVLSWLLNPNESHGMKDYFVKKFIRSLFKKNRKLIQDKNLKTEEIFLWDYDEVEIFRENNHIDILLVDSNHKMVIAIENKIDSKEHSNQLARYKAYVEKNYPSYKNVLVYLTKHGDESSDPFNWLSYSYEDVLEFIRDSLPLKDEKVSMFLKDYEYILRRKIMTDENLIKICRNIYKKHKKALDLIYEYKPDTLYEIGTKIKNLMKDANKFEINQSNKKIIRLTDDALRNLNDKYRHVSNGWVKDNSLVLYEIKISEKSISIATVVGPTDDNSRTEFINKYLKEDKVKVQPSKKYTTIKTTKVISYKEGEPIDDIKARIEDKLIDKLNNHSNFTTNILNKLVLKN